MYRNRERFKHSRFLVTYIIRKFDQVPFGNSYKFFKSTVAS